LCPRKVSMPATAKFKMFCADFTAVKRFHWRSFQCAATAARLASQSAYRQGL
jgi:hypothetical protein